MNDLFHACSMCHHRGLRPGILNTRHGDYGIRQARKDEKELSLNEYGLCAECADLVEGSLGKGETKQPRETTSLDSFIAHFFEAFDNRGGRIPKRAEIDALFVENAVILHNAGRETVVLTVSEFAEPRVALLTSGRLREFSEWETASTTQMFSNFAVRVSQYSKSGVLDSSPYEGRGTKLFQLAIVNGHWRIVSLCWYDSDA